MKIKDEFGQEWFSFEDAVSVSPMTKRLMIRQGIDALEARKVDGRTDCTFVSSGDTTVVIMRTMSGAYDVHDCKTRLHTFDYKRT